MVSFSWNPLQVLSILTGIYCSLTAPKASIKHSSHAGHTHGNSSSLTQRATPHRPWFLQQLCNHSYSSNRKSSIQGGSNTLQEKHTLPFLSISYIFMNLLPSLERFQNLGIHCNCKYMLAGKIKQLRATLARWPLAIRRIQLGLRVPHCKEISGHVMLCAWASVCLCVCAFEHAACIVYSGSNLRNVVYNKCNDMQCRSMQYMPGKVRSCYVTQTYAMQCCAMYSYSMCNAFVPLNICGSVGLCLSVCMYRWKDVQWMCMCVHLYIDEDRQCTIRCEAADGKRTTTSWYIMIHDCKNPKT